MACIQKRVVRNIVSLDESASCADAARCMAEQGVGSVGVLRGGRVVGLVSERDLVRGVIGAGAAAGRTPIGEVMRRDVPSVSLQATDRECAQLMRRHGTRHLAVKDGEVVVGVVSLLDLVDLVVEEKQGEIESLESFIRGGRAMQLSQPTTTIFSHAV
jgi:CBS domain-containing protein